MTPLDKLLDAVDELTKPHRHEEPYQVLKGRTWDHKQWRTTVPSLLDQLEEAVEPSGSTEAGHRIPSSTPAARLEALDVLAEIDTEAAQSVVKLGGSQRMTTSDNLRMLVGLAVTFDEQDPDLRDIASLARAWRVRAAVVTGWEVPARQPSNTCPICGELGTLRIRLNTGTGSGTAFCTNCRKAWDEQNLGLLAEHLRWENGEDDTSYGVLAHRPYVVAGYLTNPTSDARTGVWKAECRACGWGGLWKWKAAALTAAELHRDTYRLEEASA